MAWGCAESARRLLRVSPCPHGRLFGQALPPLLKVRSPQMLVLFSHRQLELEPRSNPARAAAATGTAQPQPGEQQAQG